MAGYVNGGMGTNPVGSTANILNSTGVDRLLLIHYFPVSANTVQAWKSGSALVPISTMFALSSGAPYDLGPLFFGSSESLVGGLATSSGTYHIDEMRL